MHNLTGADAQKKIQELNDQLRLAEVGKAEASVKFDNANKEMLEYREAYNGAYKRAVEAEKARDNALLQLATKGAPKASTSQSSGQ
jgi:hypothetical protein